MFLPTRYDDGTSYGLTPLPSRCDDSWVENQPIASRSIGMFRVGLNDIARTTEYRLIQIGCIIIFCLKKSYSIATGLVPPGYCSTNNECGIRC